MNLKLTSTSNDKFYLSGLIAFSIYFICFILFAFYLHAPSVKKFDAFSKTTVLELDIMIEVPEKKVAKRNTTTIKNTKKSHEVVKKSASKTAKPTNNVKSLFANVKVKAQKVIEKEVNNVVKTEVASRFRSKFERQRKTSNVSVSKLLDNVKARAKIVPSSKSSDNYDPYFSKIYEILNQNWNPLLIEEKLSAKVIVLISSNGSFDYRILSSSGDEQFDDSLKSFLQRQRTVVYPTHDRGSIQKIEVTFTSEKG